MHLPVAPEVVFDALDSSEGRKGFWAESAEESDGAIDFRFINGFACRCRILERDRPRTWALEYFTGEARFELASDGEGGTDLLLRHEGVSEQKWQEVHAGWLNVLFPLKAYVVHGVDLRNHDPDRSWDQGYADQ
jgi:uncharacterized protein YndB with AHSA1/START domain